MSTMTSDARAQLERTRRRAARWALALGIVGWAVGLLVDASRPVCAVLLTPALVSYIRSQWLGFQLEPKPPEAFGCAFVAGAATAVYLLGLFELLR